MVAAILGTVVLVAFLNAGRLSRVLGIRRKARKVSRPVYYRPATRTWVRLEPGR